MIFLAKSENYVTKSLYARNILEHTDDFFLRFIWNEPTNTQIQ